MDTINLKRLRENPGERCSRNVAGVPQIPTRENSRHAAMLGFVIRPEGLEPSTPCLEGRCSIHLSYGRAQVIYDHLVESWKVSSMLVQGLLVYS